MSAFQLQTRNRRGKVEYRILNASRQVVAQGVLNCSEDDHEKDLKKVAKLIAEVWKTEDEDPGMSRESYDHDTAWYIRQLRKLGYKDEISAEDFNEAWDMAARKEDLDSGCHGDKKLNSAVGTSFDAMGFEMAVQCSRSEAVDIFDELAEIFEDNFPDEFEGPASGTINTNLGQERAAEGSVFKVVFSFDTVGKDADEFEQEIADIVYDFNQELRDAVEDEADAIFVDIVDSFEN